MRVAICLRGSIGKYKSQLLKADDLYLDQDYVNYKATRKSIQLYLENQNPNVTFDFFYTVGTRIWKKN